MTAPILDNPGQLTPDELHTTIVDFRPADGRCESCGKNADHTITYGDGEDFTICWDCGLGAQR